MSSPHTIRYLLIGCALLAGAGCTVQPVAYEPPPPPRMAVYVAMEAPPPLPVYEQPPCPHEGYHWVPGYWAWGGAGYYWVPGIWVMPPRVGVFWTPGYWAFVAGGRYEFRAGYWSERVGYYGGINYGGGYFGSGFVGGRWEGNTYRYNAAVTNVVNVRNVYHETVVNNVTINNITRVSYSGGQGGARTELTPEERMAERMPHLQPTTLQLSHEREAAANPPFPAGQNHGRTPVAAPPATVEQRPSPALPPPPAAREVMPASAASAPANARTAPGERAAEREARHHEHPKPKPKRDERRDQKRDEPEARDRPQ